MSNFAIGVTPYCQNVAILAGHYCVAPDLDDLSHSGQAEELSFRKGAEFYLALRAQGKHVMLYLWVNDIGISAAPQGSNRK